MFVEALRRKHPDAFIDAVDVASWIGPWPDASRSLCGSFATGEAFHEFGSTCKMSLRSRYDLVVGNPPYRDALRFVLRSLLIADNVVFLLRIGWLSSLQRFLLFRCVPPSDFFVLPGRPSFTGKGSDRSDYCWVAWSKSGKPTQTRWLWPKPGSKGKPLQPDEIRLLDAAISARGILSYSARAQQTR